MNHDSPKKVLIQWNCNSTRDECYRQGLAEGYKNLVAKLIIINLVIVGFVKLHGRYILEASSAMFIVVSTYFILNSK